MRQQQTKNSSNTYSARERIRIRKRQHSLAPVITILLCVLIGVFYNKVVLKFNRRMTPTNKISTTNKSAPNLYINSTNAILVDFENGTILFDKNGAAKMYPASMTKIMTAIVALEHIKDLNEKVFLDESIFWSIYNADAVTAGFVQGEYVRAIDLIYGLLLPSGAECAIGLAEYVSGSESNFADLMNDKAQELGMSGTHFINATGLHDEGHYSTAKDISVLLAYALKNDTFYEVFTSASHSSQPTNLHNDGITYYSTLFSNMSSGYFHGGSILGGKTGYTEEAGQCLASLAKKEGRCYILVTCGAQGAPKNRKTQNLHIDDAITIYTAIASID